MKRKKERKKILSDEGKSEYSTHLKDTPEQRDSHCLSIHSNKETPSPTPTMDEAGVGSIGEVIQPIAWKRWTQAVLRP